MNFRRTTWGVGLLGALALPGCGGDDTPTPDGTDAGSVTTGGGTDASAGSDSSTTTTADAAAKEGGAALIARGDYLVNHVAACPDCHTPHLPNGSLDPNMHLAGSAMPFADVDPTDATKGNVYVKNITSDMATGIGAWTDAQIKAAFLNGVGQRKEGGTTPLFPIMPYFVFHNMLPADADAVVAYLRSVKPISNAVPEDQPLSFNTSDSGVLAPSPSVDPKKIPDTTLSKEAGAAYDSAVRGKYLAGNIGICMECHTEHNPPSMGLPSAVLKETAFFAGNEMFPSASLGLPSPPFPPTIYSANITPDATGIAGWTAQDVANALKKGVTKDGKPLCPPMPFGPGGSFGLLTDSDALDIGNYITTLPPIANPMIPFCVAPGAPPGDGGGSESSTTDGSTSDGPAE